MINPETRENIRELDNLGTFWLQYNELTQKLFGFPTENDINFTEESGYYSKFTIKIEGTDKL